MKKLVIVALASLFATGVAFAAETASEGGCESKALSKEGKPLFGAAKAAFMKKCERGGNTDNTPSNEAPPAKSAQQEKMKNCNKEATGKKSDERKKFMSECLKK